MNSIKSIRGFALGLALGIAAAIATVGLAQSTKPVDQAQKAESCSAMSSCCCHGDSAKHSGAKEHSQVQMKHSSEGGCCCCGGDSCSMEMKVKDEAPKP
jgi:hypothetical protein